MKIIIAILILGSSLLATRDCVAQCGKSRNLYQKKLAEADLHYLSDNFHLAMPIYSELYYMDSTNAAVNLKLGICLFKVRRKTLEALPYLEKARVEYPEACFYLGQLYHKKLYFDKALEMYQDFKNSGEKPEISLDEVENLILKSINAKHMIINKGSSVVATMGTEINTAYSEYVPLLTPDENTMYFTSRRAGSTGELLDPYSEYFEDIYVCRKTGDLWGETINLGNPLNTSTHDACVTLSKDGQRMYIYRTSPDLIGGDIYLSTNNDGVWTEPEPVNANINSPGGAETSLTISPDENTLYFSSNREGGYGGKDLYRVTKMPDGTWSLPMNLGPTINTPYDEDGPFIHPDGITLFFCSTGHKNMGGYDIFKSTKQENGQWTAPENLGYPVNSVIDDMYLITTFDGRIAYFSSNREEGMGNMDIYKAELVDPSSSQLILKGSVTTNEPTYMSLKAVISIIDIETKELQGIYRTGANGRYILVLLPKKHYKILVESDGYYPYTGDIDLTQKLTQEDLFRTINLKAIVNE